MPCKTYLVQDRKIIVMNLVKIQDRVATTITQIVMIIFQITEVGSMKNLTRWRKRTVLSTIKLIQIIMRGKIERKMMRKGQITQENQVVREDQEQGRKLLG